jgi:hypothetical protein
MASSLELAKLITAGYLYNYWEKINKTFRIYLSIAVVILVLITSLGIYGFLTSAFQDTFNQYSIKDKQLSFLQQKEKFWEDDVARYDVELGRISQNISTLSNAKATGIQVRDTSSSTGFRNTISTTELRLSQKRIGVEEENRKGVQSKREVASDSLQSIQIKILNLESMEGVSSELGPLEYLSGLLDRPMDVIINWFILIIIFVFDPLAVALVIAFNNAVLVDRGIVDKKKVVAKRELYGEDDDSDDSITFPSDEEEWVNDESKDDTDDEWDEDHALDMVMNDMVSDMDVEDFLSEDELNEYYTIKSNDREKFLEDEIEESEEWEDDVEPNEVLNEAVNSYKDFINPLDNLKKDTSRRGIDIDGDGTIDGYDNNGDGLIDEPAPSSSQRAKYVMNEKPFYARPNFNWGDRSKWINNQNAVNYWLTFIKNESDSSYPTDFNSKTY